MGAIHIHAMALIGGVEQVTTQLYFDQATNDLVTSQEPYDARGPQQTRNEEDVLWGEEARSSLTFDVRRVDEGLIASFPLGIARSV